MTPPSPPFVRSIDSVPPEKVDRSRGTALQILIGPTDGAPNFITRRFTLEPGGRIPSHRHDTIEHEQVMLAGTMMIGLDDHDVEVTEGDCVFIPAGVAHWYENRSDTTAVFLCMVPTTVDYRTEWLEPAAE
jgi:quercetin dioxygenase-like cupin family protein